MKSAEELNEALINIKEVVIDSESTEEMYHNVILICDQNITEPPPQPKLGQRWQYGGTQKNISFTLNVTNALKYIGEREVVWEEYGDVCTCGIDELTKQIFTDDDIPF